VTHQLNLARDIFLLGLTNICLKKVQISGQYERHTGVKGRRFHIKAWIDFTNLLEGWKA
jgi:hypothetical protein